MDREYAISYLQTELGLSREDAERKLDSLIHVYEPELDALSVSRGTSLTSEDEVYFIRIIDNEK